MSTNKKVIYKRILLKISGESLQDINTLGINVNSVIRIVQEIKCLLKIGVQVGLVIGSGNLFRGITLYELGISRVVSDQIGMLSTIINSLAVKDVMNSLSINTCVMSSFPINGLCEIYHWEKAISLLCKNVIVIFGAGIGNPFFTTDSAACVRGIETRSNILLKGTKVNGVYSDDPKINPQAFFYKNLKYDDVLKKNLKVMDLTAFSLARDHNLPIRIFNIHQPGALYHIVTGSDIGTLIS